VKTRINRLIKQFNWRFLLVRILVNAIALAVTAAVVPKIYFVDKSVGNWLLMAVTLGVLNALLKPILQFLTLQFIFVTYGLVMVLVNSLLRGCCRSSSRTASRSKTSCGCWLEGWSWGCSAPSSKAC
jgi:hypothetical protein